MSMDLAKKTYSTTPDYFIAGTTVGIVTAAKEADGAVAAHNLVLLDGGKVKPLAAVDGTHALNVTGLYGIAAEDAASGEDAVVYLTGEFFAEGLALVLDKGTKSQRTYTINLCQEESGVYRMTMERTRQ